MTPSSRQDLATDLARALRDRSADVGGEEALLRATLQAVATTPQAKAAQPLGRRSSRSLLLLAAAVAIAAGLSTLLVSGSLQDRRLPADRTLISTAEPNASVETLDTWRPTVIDSEGVDLTTRIVGLVRQRDSFIALGWGETGRSTWTSRDGERWSLSDAATDAPNLTLFSAAANAEQLVVAGSDVSGTERPEAQNAYVQTLANGADAWRSAPVPGVFVSMAALADQFVGAMWGPGDCREAYCTTVWTSRDGLDWTMVADASAFDGGTIQQLRVLTVDGHATIAAVGSSLTGGEPRIWVSSDPAARRWQQASLERDGPVTLTDVASSNGTLLAVGNASYCCRLRAWVSADGLTWQRRGDPTPDRVAIYPESVVATPSGFFVLGLHPTIEEGRGEFRGWLTTGERPWLPVAAPAGLGAKDYELDALQFAVRDDGRIVVVGTVPSAGETRDLRAWVLE